MESSDSKVTLDQINARANQAWAQVNAVMSNKDATPKARADVLFSVLASAALPLTEEPNVTIKVAGKEMKVTRLEAVASFASGLVAHRPQEKWRSDWQSCLMNTSGSPRKDVVMNIAQRLMAFLENPQTADVPVQVSSSTQTIPGHQGDKGWVPAHTEKTPIMGSGKAEMAKLITAYTQGNPGWMPLAEKAMAYMEAHSNTNAQAASFWRNEIAAERAGVAPAGPGRK